MAGIGDHFALLGAEFNDMLGRADGEFVAKFLHGRLGQDLTDWFYDRLYRVFDGIPESEWSEQEQFNSEFRSRNEVSCFQAIEAALDARDLGYVPAARAEWFADWCLRLNLGVGAPDAKQHRYPHYWDAEQDRRVKIFCTGMASALPETENAYFFIYLYQPLLSLLTKASIAAAFSDHATARSLASEHNAIDARLQSAINQFTTGGGVCYVVSSGGNIIITESENYGNLYYVWSTQELAERMATHHKDSSVTVVNYREFYSHVPDLKRLGVGGIVVDLGSEDDMSVVSIDDFAEALENVITNADASDFGVAYYEGVS